MKTAETKSTHSQQHTAANMQQPFFNQEQEGAFFSEQSSEYKPFFPGADTSSFIQPKYASGHKPFFQPTTVPLIQAKCATCEAEEGEQQKEHSATERLNVQRMPAFESEADNNVQRKPLIQLQTETETEPEEDNITDTDLQPKLASNAVDPPEDVGESSENELPFTQAKLTIGKPNDRYEREADTVADRVVAMPKQRAHLTPSLQNKPLSKTITKLAQRQVASVQPKRLQGLPKVQKQGDGSLKASSDIASRLSSSRSRGSVLDDNTRGEMESNFGADFGKVRIHTGSDAAQLSQDLGAKAFTHGSDIYFNEGQYNPNSSEGKHLLAHELTHTVQQGASIQRQVNISTNGAPTLQLLFGYVERKFKQGLNYLAERTVPGYTLLNVVLGKNLITGDAVARSGVNLIRGYMRLSPVIGSVLLSELEETESLPQAGKWVEGKVAEFGIDFDDIARRLKLMWDEMSITKGVEGNIGIFKKHLGPAIGKIMAFSSVVMEKVKELRFEAALRLVGAGELLDALKQNPQAFKKAIDDPKTVLKQFMVGALKKGFTNFKNNFIIHFKGVLLGWLFGKAAQMGVQIPKKFDIASLFSLIAQLVGATYTQIRAMVVKRLGPKGEMIVSKLETTVTFIKDLVTKGPIALWERVKDFLSNLKEMVFSKIATLVSTEIIKAAVTKLLSMLNPAGALVQLAMTLYRVIKFFIDNWETIKSVAMGILNSIGMVALNKIGPAAAFVEKVLAQGMKLIIGFLARIFGLGGIVEKVKVLIKKISDPVKMAIGKVIDWIVAKGKKLFGKGKATAKKLKDKALAFLLWWKYKKNFKDKAGKPHKISYKGKKRSAKLIVQSTTPHTIQQLLTVVQAKSKDSEQEQAFRRLTALNPEIEKHETNLGGSLSDSDKQREYNELQKKINKATDFIAKLLPLLDSAEVPKAIMPAFQNGVLAHSFKAMYITNDQPAQTPKGEDASVNKGQTLKGWRTLQNFIISGGKTVEKKDGTKIKVDASVREIGNYVKMHLLHDGLGGRATDSNLVPAKSGVNIRFYHQMEKFAVKDINPQKNKNLWYSVAVKFHPESPSDGIQGIDYSGYPKSVVAKYGHLDHNSQTSKWEQKSARPQAFTDSDIEIPNFGKAVDRKFNPNKDGWKNLMAMEDADNFPGFNISQEMARFINAERIHNGDFSSYSGDENSFVTRLNDRASGNRPGRPPAVPVDFSRAMSLINSLHSKARFIV